MKASLRHKKRSCLADSLKKFTQLSLQRHKTPTIRTNPARRCPISSEYLNSPHMPGVCIHIVQLASSSVTTASIKESENVLGKLKRYIRPSTWWKSDDALTISTRDKINIPQKLDGVRASFSCFRKSHSSSTAESARKASATSTSVDYMPPPPAYHQGTCSRAPTSITQPSQIHPSASRNTTFSGATTAEMEPTDWPPLTSFPNHRLSGAHQSTTIWQISPSRVRASTRHSDGAHHIEYGTSQLTPLDGQYRQNQRADCPVTNWLDGLPDEPPTIRRIAGVENLHELQASHTI
ncbi:hypothetical protein ACJ72_07629 [Emergomyces africanus]|uniref:Uncharacterized protein n=1 Tax=Emergomyces africanus TaxID=1955775 RepID=A0A1B7NN19_9EURO|nr:hypothetical protein ACJ72_07629 [Emergomyces africanus]